MNGNKQTLSTLETVFTVLIALSVFLPQGHAIDAAHARASALFRLAMVITGLIGLVTVYILKRRLPPDAPGVSSLPGRRRAAGAGRDSHRHRVTPAAARRGEWYVMTHHWQTALTLLAFPLFWFLISLAGGIGSPVTLLARLALIFLAWFALFGLIFWLQMRKRYPRPDSVRLCTTTLTTTGFRTSPRRKPFPSPGARSLTSGSMTATSSSGAAALKETSSTARPSHRRQARSSTPPPSPSGKASPPTGPTPPPPPLMSASGPRPHRCAETQPPTGQGAAPNRIRLRRYRIKSHAPLFDSPEYPCYNDVTPLSPSVLMH